MNRIFKGALVAIIIFGTTLAQASLGDFQRGKLLVPDSESYQTCANRRSYGMGVSVMPSESEPHPGLILFVGYDGSSSPTRYKCAYTDKADYEKVTCRDPLYWESESIHLSRDEKGVKMEFVPTA
ncbi:MAG TPA: hypothetical protein VN132_14660, partial [Bdellovibrio sp.]|nr:hypothetical protein [Bdellovibrio sp.]